MKSIGVILFFLLYQLTTFALNKPWRYYQNISASKYQTVLDNSTRSGYRLIDFEINKSSSQKRLYSTLFVKDSKIIASAVRSQLTSSQFSTQWQQYRDAGYQLVDQEVYRLGARTYYAGIWHKYRPQERRSWRSLRNYTPSSHQQQVNSLSRQGFIPTQVEVYRIGSNTRYASIWIKNKEGYPWVLRSQINPSNLSSLRNTYGSRGYRIKYIRLYNIGATKRYTVIWVKDGATSRFNVSSTPRNFLNQYYRQTDAGYYLTSIESSQIGNTIRPAGIWAPNKSRYNYEHRGAITNLINDYLDDNPAMGLTVAVRENGSLRYVRGFGHANKAGNVFAYSGTVYRTASIAKAVTGVLAMKLRDQGIITNFNNGIQSYLPALPNHHNYSIGDTLTNRSLVRHYIPNDPFRTEAASTTTAWDAVELFMDDALLTSDANQYVYSTHAYTVFAAAIEALTGQTFCSILRSRVSIPYSLPSLNCEFRNNANSKRSLLYTNDDGNIIERTPDDLRAKRAGGGLESNVLDLASLGQKLKNLQIMTQANLDEMTTRPSGTVRYGYGWDYGTHNGNAYYAKAGGQRGARSYMRVYPDENIVIVIMANTPGSVSTSVALTQDIAEELF